MKISVVIPCHNGAKHIVRVLSSFAQQTSDNYQIVFVDDCSTDGSFIIAERLAPDFNDFVLLKNEDCRGPGGARNRGIDAATGEYIWYVDCDDWVSPDAIERISAEIDKHKSPDVVLLNYAVIRPSGVSVTVPTFKQMDDLARCAVGPWTTVFKRELAVKFPEYTICEDTAWHFEQFDKFKSACKMDGNLPVYYYDRKNTTAITDTVEWCGQNARTMEQLAFTDELVKAGKNDKWISDLFRNYANMYDVRHKLKTPWMRKAWAARFKRETANIFTGHYSH